MEKMEKLPRSLKCIQLIGARLSCDTSLDLMGNLEFLEQLDLGSGDIVDDNENCKLFF